VGKPKYGKLKGRVFHLEGEMNEEVPEGPPFMVTNTKIFFTGGKGT